MTNNKGIEERIKADILKKTKTKIYVAMFGKNFVHVEKLVPAEDKKVEVLLSKLFDRGFEEGKKAGFNSKTLEISKDLVIEKL